MPTCPQCELATGPEDRYCMTCGAPLAPEAPDEPERSEAPAEPERSEAPVSEPAADLQVSGDEPTDLRMPVGVAPTDADLVACPACGASNAARRRRCGRCNVSLRPESQASPTSDEAVPDGQASVHVTTPDVPPLLLDEQPVGPPEDPPTGLRRRTVGALVVLVGVLLGSAVGVAAGLGVGPFATVEPVAFDPRAYPDEPAVLDPATDGASSTAPSDGARSFGPEQATDGDLATAWAARDADALLQHGFVAAVWIDRIEIATGDQVDAATFAAAGRVTGAMVDLGSLRLDASIAATDGVQVIPLPQPVLTDEVTWEVTATIGGVGAISEVRYVGWPADEDDRRAYEAS